MVHRVCDMKKVDGLWEKEVGYLKVLYPAPDRVTPSGQHRKMWLCKCNLCGREKEIGANDLKSGRTKSCGCLREKLRNEKRNKRTCVICGEVFTTPPSNRKVTCSVACRKAYARIRVSKRVVTADAKAKMSLKAKDRDMESLQKMAVRAAMVSPKAGRFETNVNAKDWHLVSPEGEHFFFHSLNYWLRENGEKYFGCRPDSREMYNAASGLCAAKYARRGGKYRCCTYKGWMAL